MAAFFGVVPVSPPVLGVEVLDFFLGVVLLAASSPAFFRPRLRGVEVGVLTAGSVSC